MVNVKCFNPISNVGLDLFGDDYIVADSEDYQAALVRSCKLHDVEFPNTLDAIGRAGAGVNNIPLDRCSEEGIVVFNTPGANANGVKELVLASLLLASRDIVEGINWANSLKGEEEVSKKVEKGKSQFAGPEVLGKKLGVVGLGAIGAMVANSALGLGMDVIGYDPFISVEAAWGLSSSIKRATSLDEIISECDYISIHVPLMDSTKNMFDKKVIDNMKDGVRILNFSRAGLVNEDDLKVALESGKASKYVTDFPTENTLTLPNAICIPHLGASTPESEDNCAIMAVNQIKEYLENGNIKNSVNFPECSLGTCTTKGRVSILHKNIPRMVGQITNVFADANINIADMINRSKNDWAYTMIDIEDVANEDITTKLENIEGVVKVKIIK